MTSHDFTPAVYAAGREATALAPNDSTERDAAAPTGARHVEHPLEVDGVDADAVVGDGELPASRGPLRSDLDAERRGPAPELDRVDDQVLEHLTKLDLVHAEVNR